MKFIFKICAIPVDNNPYPIALAQRSEFELTKNQSVKVVLVIATHRRSLEIINVIFHFHRCPTF